MTLSEKMDVLDFIINALREHEKKLDELIFRLEQTIGRKLLEDWR